MNNSMFHIFYVKCGRKIAQPEVYAITHGHRGG